MEEYSIVFHLPPTNVIPFFHPPVLFVPQPLSVEGWRKGYIVLPFPLPFILSLTHLYFTLLSTLFAFYFKTLGLGQGVELLSPFHSLPSLFLHSF